MLNSEKSAEIVTCLQTLFLQETPLGKDPLDKIDSLKNHADLGVRFWARKVYNKFVVSQAMKLSSESGEQALENSVETEILQKKLSDVQKSTFMAISVLEQMLKKAEPQSLPFLISHLKAVKDPFQVSFLVKHLCFCFPSEELLNIVLPFLRNSDDRVVANAIEGIERLHTEKGIPFFSEMLRHKNQRVRANAAKALFRFDKEKTYKVLSRMLMAREEPHHVLAACFAVRELKEPRFLPVLSENLGYRVLFEDTLTAIRSMNCDESNKVVAARHQEFKLFEKRLAESLGEIRVEESFKSPWFKTIQAAKYLITVLMVFAIIWIIFFPSPLRKAQNKLSEMSISATTKSLSDAIQSKNEAVVKLLIYAGVDPMGRSDDGTPFFHSAISIGNVAIFKALQDAITELNPNVPSEEIVNRITKLKNTSGETVLHIAARTGKTDLLRYLLDNSFDPEVKDENGNTLLHAAIQGDQEEALVFLLTQKLKVDEKNGRGLTPLHIAVMDQKSRIIYWLVKLGNADPKLMTNNGLSAIDLGFKSF